MVYLAFPDKHKNMWIYNKSEEEALRFLQEGLDFRQAIYSVRDKEILGVIGLNMGGAQKFFRFQLAAFLRVFGPLGGLWRYAKYSAELMFHMPLSKHAVKIDPIVVSEKARGMGIGSRLLESVYQYAEKKRLKAVVLEVVNTNPKAKKLYERQGFMTVKTLKSGWFTKKAGFSELYYMRKILQKQ